MVLSRFWYVLLGLLLGMIAFVRSLVWGVGTDLAACVAGADRDSLPEALQRYEALRRPRASQVQEMSRGREVQNHFPDGPEQERRDAGFAASDPLRQSAWLYGHDA